MFLLVERQHHQLILVNVLVIIIIILLVLDGTHKLFVSCLHIYFEQVWHHVVAPLTSCSECLIVDLGVFIESLNVGVYRGNLCIYNGKFLPHVGGCGPGVYGILLG